MIAVNTQGPCLNLTIDASSWPFGFMVCQLRTGTIIGSERLYVSLGNKVPKSLPTPLRRLIKQLIDFGPVLSLQIRGNRAGGHSLEFVLIPSPDDLRRLCRLLGRYLDKEVDPSNIFEVPTLLKDLLNEALCELD